MGEETALKEEMYTPQSFSVDSILEDVEVEGEVVEEQLDTPEIEIESITKMEIETPNEVAELKHLVQELQNDLLKVSKKQDTKPVDPKTEKLTRTQLVQILKEHKDDPEVLFNVAEYIAEQKAVETRDATMKDVSHRQWSTNLSGVANRILSEDEDGYLAANPKVKNGLEEQATNLGLGDHPVGRLAAYAILRLGDSMKTKKEPSADVKSAVKEIVDPNKGKMDKTRLTALKDKSSGLNAEELSMAKKFGVKPETYAKFVRRSK